jgi:hypothetical protein
MESKNNQPPIKVFRCGPVQAAIWPRTVTRDGKKVQIHSVEITKSYKNKETGEWENSHHLLLSDLFKTILLMIEVWRHYDVSTYEPETQSKEIVDGPVNDMKGNGSKH